MDKIRRQAVMLGAMAGVIGGLVFGVAQTNQGMITSIAGLFHLNNTLFGWIIHLTIS